MRKLNLLLSFILGLALFLSGCADKKAVNPTLLTQWRGF